jgi:hypothetical protein
MPAVQLLVDNDLTAVLLSALRAPANLELGEETLSMLHPTLRALVPSATTDESEDNVQMDTLVEVRRDALESMLLLANSEVGKEELSSRYIFPLMESHYDAELDPELARLNQFVVGSLIIASDDEDDPDAPLSDAEAERRIEAAKNFVPGFFNAKGQRMEESRLW